MTLSEIEPAEAASSGEDTSAVTMSEPVPRGAKPGASGAALRVALMTGGIDRPYAYGMCTALAAKGVVIELLGFDELDIPEIRELPGLKWINLYGGQRTKVGRGKKALRLFAVYARLMRYAATTRAKIFHILWNNRIQLFDRTLLMLYYKLLGKRLVFTAHNVNAGLRDGTDSVLNRWSLHFQYRMLDHIFVHTEQMKQDLLQQFAVQKEKVSVIPFGINNSVPVTEITAWEVKRKLGIHGSDKTILFFGRIRPYKGLAYLVKAFQAIAARDDRYRLIIAGEPKKDSLEYWREVQKAIGGGPGADRVIQHAHYIGDDETELYFKAADVLVLPYTQIFQSGVLFLSYSFGLPVIATETGSLQDDILPGKTGYTCRPCDETDLAHALVTYFESDLFKNLGQHRSGIADFARRRNSWDHVSEMTCRVYADLLGSGGSAHQED